MTEGGVAGLVGADVVVVLNYRGHDDTVRCLASLAKGSPTAVVVLVDNGSDDGVLDTVTGRWPSVVRIQTGRNLGFSGGMNVGLEHALHRGARTVTVLNNDTVVPPGAIDALVARAVSGPVAVSPEIRRLDTGEVWFGAGAVDADTGLARHLGDAEIATLFAPGVHRDVESLAGCCITASSDTWRRVGIFDDRFFLLFEDAEWSLRARRSATTLVVDPAVRIDHVVSASFTGAAARTGLYYYTRNGLLFGSLLDQRSLGRPVRAARFVRRHVAPVPVSTWRQGNRAEAVRGGLVVVVATLHHLARCHGRAPRWLERWLRRSPR